MKSKEPKREDYQPHTEDETELMLTLKLLPLLHLLFIGSLSGLIVKICPPYAADVESYKPHLDLISKLEEGGWLCRDEGAPRAGPPGFVVKKGHGG